MCCISIQTPTPSHIPSPIKDRLSSYKPLPDGEEICADVQPWVRRALMLEQCFSRGTWLVFLACVTLCYQVLYVFVDSDPEDRSSGPQTSFLYPLIRYVQFLQDPWLECGRDDDFVTLEFNLLSSYIVDNITLLNFMYRFPLA